MKPTLYIAVLRIAIVAALLLPACGPAAQRTSKESTDQAIGQIERELEALRKELLIPGLSPTIVQNQEFGLDGEQVKTLTLRAGPLAAEYEPVPAGRAEDTS